MEVAPAAAAGTPNPGGADNDEAAVGGGAGAPVGGGAGAPAAAPAAGGRGTPAAEAATKFTPMLAAMRSSSSVGIFSKNWRGQLVSDN